jgi:hypothetical protein
MAHPDAQDLIRRLVAGDPTVGDVVMRQVRTSEEPLVLVVAALSRPAEADLLARALRTASSPRDRQVIAVAAAFLAGETDRVQVLAREHLLDHPDSDLVAWLAASAPDAAEARRLTQSHPQDQEES